MTVTQHNDEQEALASIMDKVLAAASPNAVFGQPIESAGYTVITASEIAAGGGFGSGGGSAPQPGGHDGPAGLASGYGSGGGGGSQGRPVAVIYVGPDGVKVQPIVDVTKLAVAGITAWGAMAVLLGRMARSARQR